MPEQQNMAALCLDKPAAQVAIRDLTDGGRQDITFGALNEMTDGLARALQKRVAPGARVGVLLSQTPWCAAAHCAAWKIGAVSLPLFKLFKRDALQTRLEDAGCEIVLTDAEGAALVGDLAQSYLVDQFGEEGPAVPYAEVAPETPSILMYTSGTTGRPKGALHGHRLLAGHLTCIRMVFDDLGQEGDCLWTPADWAWIGGLFNVLLSGLAMGVPVAASRMEKFSAEECQRLIKRGGIRNVFFPPTALRMLKASGLNLEGLRSVGSGGEPLGAEMLAWGERALGVTINEFYGQTECNVVVTSSASQFPPRPGAMGKTVPGFDVDVIDDSGKPTLEEGDIAVRKGAPTMMLEYWRNPQATSEKFRGDWLLTGDRGRRDGDYFTFVGREDDVITSSGYRIGPAEIEDCLLTHPAVATVGVVGKPDALRTEIVKAYVVKAAKVSAGDLQDYVKSRLASHSYPREIAFVPELPMTVTGKVIRKALKARAQSEGSE